MIISGDPVNHNEKPIELQPTPTPFSGPSMMTATPTPPPYGGISIMETTPADGLTASSVPPLPLANLAEDPEDAGPIYTRLPDGSYIKHREIDRDELTPFGQRMFDVNPDSIIDAMVGADTSGTIADVRRQIFARMDVADKLLLTLPEQAGSLADIEAKTGYSPGLIRYLQDTDPDHLKREIEKNEVLANSGYVGYITQQMQNPQSRQAMRGNHVIMSQLEADILGVWGTTRDHVGRDFRIGVGQVGVFASKAAAGVGQLLFDTVDLFTHPLVKAGAREAGWTRSNVESLRNYLGEAAKDNEARWLGPAIDTGNPITDWVRTSVFQGTPFLAGSVGLALVPGVGVAGAAGVIATGMGLETYGETRAAGVSPLLAAAAGGATFATSYFVNRFQLGRWTRNVMGRAPFRQFSVGAAIETGQEFATESIESLGQGFFEATAKLHSGPGYTRDDFWRDMKESAFGALQEGGAAGTLSMLTRMVGLPAAIRNQARAYQFNNSFKDMGTKAAQTTLFKEQPTVLAQEINSMARHHGGAGIVFSSAMELEQGGLTRQEVCDGLGISREEFDFAKANNVDLAIPVGNAVVFAQQQAEVGNTYFQDVLRADPDAMTGREIAAQANEFAATLEVAETHFKAMAEQPETGMPLRLRTFRAGLRAFGFSPNEADASTAVFWARGERAAEQWGITLDQWLEQRPVRLEMEGILKNNRQTARYQSLLEQVDRRGTARDIFAEDGPAAALAAVVDEAVPFANVSPAIPPIEQVAQSEVAAPVDESAHAVQDLVQPVETAEDDAAWVDSVAETVAAELAAEGGEREAVVEQARQILAAGLEMPEVREIAEQAGILPPAAPAAAPSTRETPEGKPANVGRRTKIIFPKESGMPAIPANYAVVEMDSLRPSHTFRNYTPNPAWTAAELAQQRNYDSGSMEAVRQGIELDRLDFDALFNPATDAVNGPPIVTEDGKILGGNNRSHRIYNRYEQDLYRDNLVAYLADEAENLTGISPEIALNMNRPVLVRIAHDVAAEDIPGLIGALNADFTNRRDPANLAANRGSRVGDRTLAAFAGINDQTVAAYLDSPTVARRVLQAMVEDGALQGTDLPGLYDFQNDRWLGDGRISGKAQIEQAMFGAILPDSRLLDDLSDSMKRKLIRALPGLIRLRRNNSPELANLFEAIAMHNDFQTFKASPEAKGLKPAAALELFRKPNQADLFTGETPPEKSGPAWDMFLDLNRMKTQRDVADFFTRKADELAGVGRGLFGGMQLNQGGTPVIEELYQSAYHGSPYRFDKFSLDEIGTGEGNQAFGWGLYFSGEREVSELYRESLSTTEYYAGDRKLAGNEAWAASFLLDDNNKKLSINEASAIAANIIKADKYPEILNLIVQLSNKNLSKRDGQLYKVDIPEADVLLDWDKKLSEQPDAIKDALLNANTGDRFLDRIAHQAGGERSWNFWGNAAEFYRALTGIFADKLPLHYTVEQGENIAQKDASLFLNSLGIKGIRYLDGNSRKQGEGTYNYVIFDDNAIEILETYYQGQQDFLSPRGSISFTPDATIINLFKGADVSTVIHELNHLFVFDLQQMVAAGKGGDRARADLAALTAFAGGKLDRAGYERIAQAWERYAMEGRAPSPDLYDAFDTFRKYLSRIYRNATEQIGVEPPANIRAVFDRFLATDAEIADAGTLYQQSEQWWEKMENMDAAAKERLRVMHERANNAERRRRDVEGGGKALGRLAGVDFNKTREKIRGREANTPVYRAVSAAKERGGFDRAEAEQLVGKPAADEIARRHGEEVYGGAVDMDATARESGFTSSTDMLSSLSEMESLEDAIDAEVRAGLDAEDRARENGNENRGDDDFADETDEEEEFLREQSEAAVKLNNGGARALREWRIKYQAKKIAVERRIGGMDMHQAMDLRRFEKAKRDAQKAADRAALRGDVKALSEYRDQVLLHHLMIRECQKARTLNARVQDEYGTRALLKTLQADQYHPRVEDAYAETIKAIATFMGFTQSRRTRPSVESETLVLPGPEPGSSVADFLPDLAGTMEPWMLSKTRPTNFTTYRDFTFNQIKEADRVLRLLVNQGRGELQAFKDLGVANLEEMVRKSLEPMARRKSRPKQKDDRSFTGRAANAVSDFFISITTPETWFMMMDGNPTIQGKEAGFNQRMFWALRDCQTEKDRLYKDMMTRWQPDFSKLEQAKADIEKQFGKSFLVPGVNFPAIVKTGRGYETFDADMLVSIALQMGNDANLYALQQGYGFTDSELQAIGRLFSAEQWQAIQGVWDSLDSLYPRLDAVTFRITNRHVPKERAQAFTVEARGGDLVQMKGGYFPLVYDPLLSDRAGQYADLENALYKGQMENVHASTRPADGMLKERARDDDGNPVVGRPQLLRTNIIVQHMDAALHYITHAEKILEFDRLTRNEDWKREFTDKFGERRYRALRNWVQDLARPKRLNNDPVSRIMEKARSLATINALGLRFKTGLKQRQGMFNAAAFMSDASRTGASGWGYVLKGMRNIGFGGNFGAKTEKMRQIDAQSKYMSARDGGHDREIRAMVEKLSPIDAHFTIPGTSMRVEKRKFHDFMFAWIQANDRAAAYAVWAGAYAQAVNGDANFDIAGMTEEQIEVEAIKYADSAAATQASSFAADLTAMQRGDGIGRFLGMFMSGNVRQGSRLMQYIDAMHLGDKTKTDVALLACREFVFPALAWSILAAGIKTALGDDDDDLFTDAVWEVAETTIAPFPLLREFPSSLRYGPSNLPALEMPTRAIGQIFGAPGKIADGKAGRALFDIVSGTGFFIGFPLSNVAREAQPVTDALGITKAR